MYTRKLKTICRLKFNVDSAGSIQTLSTPPPLPPPLAIMEARIYKRNREVVLVVSHLFVMTTARLMGLLNIRLLLIDEQHGRGGRGRQRDLSFSFKIFDASSNDQFLN